MKRILSIVLLICLLGGALFADNNREWRAIWSITWNQFSASASVEALKARADAILDKHVEAGMNAILWQVRQGGTVYYPSAIEPWGSYIGYSDPGYDPLAYAIEGAHKRGLELHAWFNTFHCSSTITGAPAQVHPEWVCRDGYGDPMPGSRSLSPGLKEVRDYTVNLAAEIVANYDIDGIHFDYVRWNEYDNTEFSVAAAKYAEDNDLPDGVWAPGYEDYLVKRDQTTQSNRAPMVPSASNRYLFDAEHPESGGIPDSTDLFPDATPGVKFASWGDWRRGATNVFIKAVHDTVQQLKPWVKVTPAALGRHRDASWNGYYSTFQDAARWLNEGWVDMITAMSYHYLSGSSLKSALESDWYPYITKGIAEGRYFCPGPPSYLLSGWGAHKDIVQTARTLPWIGGFQFFAYTNWKDSEYATQSSHTVFANKTKQPSYAFLNSDVPAAPTVSWVKHNDTSYTLTVTPDAGVTASQWFVIYRSPDTNIDVDSDEIMELVFSDSAFTYDITFDGLQLNAGRYYYGVSMCSRWWVESAVSNIVNTDVLPTTPPQVVVTTPENSAVNVPNNQIVRIEFNKNMDAASIDEHLTISPEPSNKTFSWDNPSWVKEDHLVLNIGASWEFNTNYTVTVGSSVVDQAGLQIDGNKDDTAGDAYVFSFTISGADEEAPVVQLAYPGQGDVGIDTDMPVTIIFDELIDKSTLTDRLQFTYIGYDVSPAVSSFSGSDDKTYLNAKPRSYFPSASIVTLNLLEGICDTAGNPMSAQSISFKTDSSFYSARQNIDNFTGTYSWWNPSGSGSTSGLNGTSSTSTLQSTNRVAGTGDSKALKITCVPTSSTWFARIHARDLYLNTTFDHTKSVLQAYVYGDGSGNKFRFSIREDGSSNTYEVSTWFTIDWEGWKLVEWDIHDPSQFGEWGGLTNGLMDGTSYGFESIQFSPGEVDPEAAFTIYFDQLRMATKAEGEYSENHPPVIESMPDTSVAAGGYVYCYAVYDDPDSLDVLTMRVIPDTSAVKTYTYSTPGKIKLKPETEYNGSSAIMVTVTDNGIGELADTAFFTLHVVSSAISEIPERFTVHQNYPNPFNPLTTLSFDLPLAEQVKIEIFNTRGQKLMTLADRQFDAGSWKVNFDASFLSSGVYFYKITAGKEYSVNRMTLLK